MGSSILGQRSVHGEEGFNPFAQVLGEIPPYGKRKFQGEFSRLSHIPGYTLSIHSFTYCPICL